MVIQIDTREKARAIQRILKTFDDLDIRYMSSKLFAGDYMLLDAQIKSTVIVDRKQTINELCGNVTKDHKRFKDELIRAHLAGYKVVVLIEDDRYKSLEDIKEWKQPFGKSKFTGEQLYKILNTMRNKKEEYDVEFRFCKKADTGDVILDILLEESLKYEKDA